MMTRATLPPLPPKLHSSPSSVPPSSFSPSCGSRTSKFFLPYSFTLALLSLILVLSIWNLIPIIRRLSAPARYPDPVEFPFESAYSLLSRRYRYSPTLARSLRTFYTISTSDYLSFHTKANSPASTGDCSRTKCLIARVDKSPTHGLGDRLRGILTTYFLSVVTRRVFMLDWNVPLPVSTVLYPWTVDPSSGTTVNFTYHFNSTSGTCCCCRYPLQPTTTKEAYDMMVRLSNHTTTLPHARIVTNGNLYHTELKYSAAHTLYMDSVPAPNVTRWFRPPPYRRKGNPILAKLSTVPTPLPSHAAIPLVLQTIFSPSNALRTHILARAPARLLHSRKYVGVHARLGYGLQEEGKDASRFDLSRNGLSLRSMARCFASTVTNPNLKYRDVFVATDTPEFRPLFAEELQKMNKEFTVRSVPNMTPVHLRDIESTGRDGINDMLDTFVDLFLLAKAGMLVHAPSGFSDLALWMGCGRHRVTVTQTNCARGLNLMGENVSSIAIKEEHKVSQPV